MRGDFQRNIKEVSRSKRPSKCHAMHNEWKNDPYSCTLIIVTFQNSRDKEKMSRTYPENDQVTQQRNEDQNGMISQE